MGGRSVRAVLEDCILYLHDGTPPTNPEDARTGTSGGLVKVTTGGVAVLSTNRSTAQSYLLSIASGGVAGNTVKVTVTVDSVETTYTYTILAADTTELLINLHVARMLNDIPEVSAICDIVTPAIWVQCRIAGLTFAIADGSGTKTVTATPETTAAREETLQFGPPIAGVISKESGATWQGTNLASGTVGYFTLCWPSDDLTVADSAYAYPRVQGTAAAVGGDTTIDPATVVKDAISSVTSFTLTLPTS